MRAFLGLVCLFATLYGCSSQVSDTGTDTDTDTDTDTGTQTPPELKVTEPAGGALTLSADLSVRMVSASGDDGNVPSNVSDGNFQTRWSQYGKGSYVTLDLGSVQTLSGAKI